MSKFDDEPLERTHIHLFASDVAWAKTFFGPTCGYSRGIRSILRAYRKRIEAKARLGDRPLAPDETTAELLDQQV